MDFGPHTLGIMASQRRAGLWWSLREWEQRWTADNLAPGSAVPFFHFRTSQLLSLMTFRAAANPSRTCYNH